MLKNLVQKLQERCPLKYIFVRSLSSLVPKNMVNNKDKVVVMFAKVIDKLYENKHLSANESDKAKLQYEEFLKDIVTRHQEKFVEFDMNKDRLDHFFQKFMDDQYKDLWKAIKMVFVIPNCQAQIERGFSVNKEMVIENLQAQSLSALRLVYDSIKATKKEVHEIEIGKKMLLSCKSAYSRYEVLNCYGGKSKS